MNISIKNLLFLFVIVLLGASLATNAWLSFNLAKVNKLYKEKQANLKVLAFRNMFTEEVLLADKEIDFDTRLALETSVRDLNNSEIFNQWQEFTKASTKEIASIQAKKLLRLLVEKTLIN